ncbi:hypothetical protein F4678DRAFT_326352 [Xylaria arbuscula]|nr:hypothetical protein F4678DRAFT_326352 [Xylaria arbuscula]
MAGLIPQNAHTDGIARMVIEFSTSMDGQCVIGMSTISAPSMHACGGTEIEIVVKEPEVSPNAICITPTSPLAPANRLPSGVPVPAPAPAPQDQTPAWWTTTSWPVDPGAATPPKPKPNNPDPPAMQVPTIPIKEDPAVPSVNPPAQTQTQPAETSCSDSHQPGDPTQGPTPSPTPVPLKEQPAVSSSSSSVSTQQSSSLSSSSSTITTSTSFLSSSSLASSTPSTLITTTSTLHTSSSSSTSSTISTSSTPHTRSIITKTITSTLRPPPSTFTKPTPTPTPPERPQQPPRPSQSQPPAPTPTPTDCEPGYTSIDISTLTGLDPHFFEKYISLLGIGHILDDVVNSVSNTLDGLGLSQWRQSSGAGDELIHEFRVRCDVDIPDGPAPVFPPQFEEHREQIIVMGHGHRDCLEMCERQAIDMAGTGVLKECIGAAYRGAGDRGECRFWWGEHDEHSFLPVDSLPASGNGGRNGGGRWQIIYM